MEYIFQREYNNSEKDISFDSFCKNFFILWKKIIEINKNENKSQADKKQIIILNLPGSDTKDYFNEIFLKFEGFIFLGEKALSKLILDLKLTDNKKINNFTNLMFRICVNYCLNNELSFISENNLDYLE